MEMPMLDEQEFSQIRGLFSAAFKSTKEYRQQFEIPLSEMSLGERFAPVTVLYEQLTGMKESNVNAIMHHRLSLYRPPCRRCHKSLRTPRAKRCGSCMTPVDSN